MSTSDKKITMSHLIKDYHDLRRKIGRQPVCLEFSKECHSITTLVCVLGRPGWRKLLESVDPKLHIRPSRFTQGSVKDCYRRLKAKLGRIPTLKEYSKSCCSSWTLNKVFDGSGWSNLLKSFGDYHRPRRYTLKGPSRAHILGAFRRIQRQLGKEPSYRQYRKLSGYSIKDIKYRYGEDAWKTLLKSAKIQKEAAPQHLTAEHLIQDFLDLQQALGRRPKVSEYLYNCHTPKVLDRVFGKPGWKNLIAAVGAKALPKDVITASHLVDDYIEIYRHLRRTPTYEDFRRRHLHTLKVLDREFGKPGWRNLKIAAHDKMRDNQPEGRPDFHDQSIQQPLQTCA